MKNWSKLIENINDTSGETFELVSSHSVGGGCINQAWHLRGSVVSDGSIVAREYFVKSNEPSALLMFEAECAALLEIKGTNSVRVPTPVVVGLSDGVSWIVMEYISLSGSAGSEEISRKLAERLFQMHACTNDKYGWHRDNTIGSTLQVNTQNNDWTDFWREQRLGYQLETAANNGYGGRLQMLGERLMSSLGTIFEGYVPEASLLHGDLWGGNWSCDLHGEPVIYDPASYYGDRECDIAMTELFGGFGPDFYRVYAELSPLSDGYPVRKILYNLYHILNHLNLFGGGYGRQAESMMEELLGNC